MEVDKVTIYDELRKMGYEFDNEYSNSEERTEVWINRKAGLAVRLEWFHAG